MRYAHILDRVIGTPLAIEPSKLTILTEEVFLKLALAEDINRSNRTPEALKISSPDTMYVIPVHGSLANKNAAGSSGMTSYEGLMRETKAAVNAGYKVIGLDVSSGGGEALGMFEFGNFFASLPEKYGIQTFSFTNSTAASAAYGLAAAAQKIFAVDTAMVGSIGTVMTLFSDFKANEKAGREYLILRSKDEKALFNPNEQISEAVISDSKKKLTMMDAKFDAYITAVRPNLTKEKIVSLKGNTLFAEEAKDFGLIDEIVTSLQDVFDLYAGQPNVVSQTQMQANLQVQAKGPEKRTTSCATTFKGKTKMNLEEALIALQEAQIENETLKASVKMETLKAQKAEQARCLALFTSGTELTIAPTTVMQAISSNFTLDQAATMFSGIRAASDAAITANINTTGAHPNAAAVQSQLAAGQEQMVNLYSLMGLQNTAPAADLAGGLLSAEDILSEMKKLNLNQA